MHHYLQLTILRYIINKAHQSNLSATQIIMTVDWHHTTGYFLEDSKKNPCLLKYVIECKQVGNMFYSIHFLFLIACQGIMPICRSILIIFGIPLNESSIYTVLTQSGTQGRVRQVGQIWVGPSDLCGGETLLVFISTCLRLDRKIAMAWPGLAWQADLPNLQFKNLCACS